MTAPTLSRYAATGKLHFITLPSGDACTVGSYVRSWQKLKTYRPGALVFGFDPFPSRADDILAALAEGMADRINQHVKGFGAGRKWSYDWQAEASRTARAVNTPRLIVRYCPKEFRARLAHRLTTD